MPSSHQISQNHLTHQDLDFVDVRTIVSVFGTDDDVRLFETLLGVYEDQWHDPDQWPDSIVAREAARRLGKEPNTFYQQFSRMKKRTRQNTARFLVH